MEGESKNERVESKNERVMDGKRKQEIEGER
jgi:hypothetical protein